MDPSIIASAIPVAGSIGAAALQRRWAIKDWERVNAYNHPKAQVARLKEAGLPLASMFGGSGGSTSSDVRGTEVDPSLGSAKGLEAYFTNRMQKKQLELMEAQLNTEKAKGETQWKEANIKANEATLSNDMLEYLINKEGPQTVAPAYQPPSNQVQLEVTKRKALEADTRTKEVVADLQRAKTQADIDHVYQTINLSKATEEGTRIINKVNDILTSNIGDKKWDLLQSMFYKFFLR